MTMVMIVFGFLMLLTGTGVVFAGRPLHSALCLVATLFLVAVHFALMGAHFLAAVQVIVYAGAIMVLVIFVIMLLGPDADPERGERFRWGLSVAAAATTGLFVALLIAAVQYGGVGGELVAGAEAGIVRDFQGTTAVVGEALFRRYLYPFELVSLLVLAAIIGSVLLGYEPKRPLAAGRGLRAKRSS